VTFYRVPKLPVIVLALGTDPPLCACIVSCQSSLLAQEGTTWCCLPPTWPPFA